MALISVNKQSKPGATTLTDIYTVPGGTSFTGKVIVANQSAVATTIRISVAPLGAADAPTQYIAYDEAIAGNGQFVSPIIDLIATDVVRVYATLATLSFTLTGLEKSAGGAAGALTVQAADGAPTYPNITTIQFDEADGFVITNPGGAGVAQIDFTGGGGGAATFLSVAKWGL